MRYLLYISVVFTSCGQTHSPLDGWNHTDADTNTTIFALYRGKPSDVCSCMALYPDSSYVFKFGACLVSARDSGTFTLSGDTLLFKSLLADKVDTSNHWHDQITPLTGRKYLLRNGRIYHWVKNGKYDPKVFWLRPGLEISPAEKLDSTGNGYAHLWNGNGQITTKAYFKNFKLISGERLYYSQKGALVKIELYKNGLKVRDSIPPREQ